MWAYVFIFLCIHLGVEFVGHVHSNILRNFQNVLQNDYVILHSHQQCIRVSIFTCTCQHLLLSIVLIIAIILTIIYHFHISFFFKHLYWSFILLLSVPCVLFFPQNSFLIFFWIHWILFLCFYFIYHCTVSCTSYFTFLMIALRFTIYVFNVVLSIFKNIIILQVQYRKPITVYFQF